MSSGDTLGETGPGVRRPPGDGEGDDVWARILVESLVCGDVDAVLCSVGANSTIGLVMTRLAGWTEDTGLGYASLPRVMVPADSASCPAVTSTL